MKTLQKNLGHTFKDKSLLLQALTHPSALPPGQENNFERLEFLGDRVLGLVIAEWLFELFPDEKEGDMAKRFTALVRKGTLVKVARSLSLDQVINMKQEKSSTQEKRLETLLSDGCEALLGAFYLEAGLKKVQTFIHQYWRAYLEEDYVPPRDPKSLLQEWAQGQGKSHPKYVVVETSGPAHSPHFIVEVHVQGLEAIQGKGLSKKEAEKEASFHMLKIISAHD